MQLQVWGETEDSEVGVVLGIIREVVEVEWWEISHWLETREHEEISKREGCIGTQIAIGFR